MCYYLPKGTTLTLFHSVRERTLQFVVRYTAMCLLFALISMYTLLLPIASTIIAMTKAPRGVVDVTVRYNSEKESDSKVWIGNGKGYGFVKR